MPAGIYLTQIYFAIITTMAGVEIIAVEGGSEFRDFIDLPWKIYAKYPTGSPAQEGSSPDAGPRQHPFWEFSDRIPFWPTRCGDRGKDRGHVDRHYNECHGENMGIWDFSNALTIQRPRPPSSLPLRRGSPEGDDLRERPAQPVDELRGWVAHRGFRLSACCVDDLQSTVLPQADRIVRLR